MHHRAARRSLQKGDVVAGSYVLREPLGAGGMGIVYEAELGRDRTVAIKVLHPDRASDLTAARRLREEAIAASYIKHPNVVSVIDYSEPSSADPFVVMEHVRGVPLGAILRETGAQSLRRSANITCQILAGLDAAHTAGVVHADIKSDNILVETREDGSEAVKIIDFGLATVHRADHPPPQPEIDRRGVQMMSGTPEYMAPEIIRGDGALPASDVYAVGVVLYEMITGATPFAGGSSSEVLDRHLKESAVPPSLRSPDRFIPLAFEHAIMRALEKAPDARHPSAAAFAEALVEATPLAEPVHDVLPTSTVPWSSSATTRNVAVPRPSHKVGKLGPMDDLIIASLERARALVDDHRVSSAARELECTLEVVTRRTHKTPQAWRLHLTLAVVYQSLGDPSRALRAATAAHDNAASTHSKLGRKRATALLDRLAATRR